MPPPLDASPVRVLLIDDDEDDFLLTRDMLADIPGGRYTLAWEADFDTALERICRNEFDVYLLDYRLGAKTGLDLLRAKQERNCPGAVILLTGAGHPEIDREAELAGAADFLEKGRLDPTLLERTIRYAIRQQAQEDELERKVAERTAELAAANAALREADHRKDEFLAMLAHELRSPLAPIRHAMEILRLSATDDRTEKPRKTIERQVRQMVRLIDDLLDASRITRGILRIELAPIELGDPLRVALETTAPLIEAGGLALDAKLPDTPLVVNGDAARLSQLFANLLSNAAKYTEPGGKVSLTVEVACTHVVVRVKDTGIGIAPDMLPRVFGLFEQANDATKRSQGGLGIGLALVKRLAELHAGTVTAHSDGLERGSEFVVSLPLLEGGVCELAT